jgi:hypothetical protein
MWGFIVIAGIIVGLVTLILLISPGRRLGRGSVGERSEDAINYAVVEQTANRIRNDQMGGL